MVVKLLKDGLNAVVDEVIDGFNLDDIIPSSNLETGAPKKFPKNLDDKEFGGLKIEFQAWEAGGIRLAEKAGSAIGEPITGIGGLDGILKSAKGNAVFDKLESVTKAVRDVKDSILSKLEGAVDATADSITDAVKNVFDRDLDKTESYSIVSSLGMTHCGTWQIFVPQTISTNYSAGWARSELQFLGNILKTSGSAGPVGSAMNAAKLINGEALNPLSELLFQGIDHRSFAYTFSLMPKNEDETELIRELVEFFKSNMTPMISPNTATLVLRYPNYFKIRYLKDGDDNKYLNKIAFCVLESFDVGYKDNGSSFHRDGSPTAVNISLKFREIEPIYRQMICKGY